MKKGFKRIGIIGRQRTTPETVDTVLMLVNMLSETGYEVLVEAETASTLPQLSAPVMSKQKIGAENDLIIVVGGDGSLINAAHAVVDSGTPVLGINRGRLGFLTDIHPNELKTKLQDVLAGDYFQEQRFLLQAGVYHDDTLLHQEIALNEVVLLPGEYSHMIEFEIYINEQLMCSQRADGQIIATPTGSTAYALSGGGPILHPKLDAIVMVPMFSHSLSNRPIVVAGDSVVQLHVSEDNEMSPRVSCDGKQRVAIHPGDSLVVKKYPKQLTLLHPCDYNYYETLRSKLHWQKKL
ncbi:MAG: NAD(+) kinase [Pseudomonadota bacterium]